MTQIAIVVYPGFTALDFIGPYEVLRWPARRRGAVRLARAGTDHRRLRCPGRRRHAFVRRDAVARRPSGTRRHDDDGARPRREAARLGASRLDTTATWTTSVCSGSIILAAAGSAGRQAGHVALGWRCRAEGDRASGGRRRTDRARGQHRDVAGVSAGIDLAVVAGRPDRRRGPRQGHPVVDRIRPAAAIRLRPHVEGIRDDKGVPPPRR